MTAFTESVVEEAALEWFAILGCSVIACPSIDESDERGANKIVIELPMR